MLVPRRHGAASNYRYGFQGQEKDDEVKGEANSLNYTFRMHDPRVGRFFAIDPLTKKYPFYSPYSFSGNRVIDMVELEGLEPANPKVNPNSHPIGDSWEKTDSDGNYTGEAYPATDLEGVTINVPKKSSFMTDAMQAVAGGVNEFIGAMTGASSISPELNAAYKAEYAPSTDERFALAIAALPALPILVEAAPIIAGGYEAYSGWYASTAVSNYVAGATATGVMIDVFGVNSLRVGAINGLTNATGQIYSNDGFSNFNYAQPVSAALFKNPFTSNFGESFFKLTKENGFETNNLFGKNFISTFGSNFIGGKLSSIFNAKLGYSPIQNVLDVTTGGAIETVENKIGDDIGKAIDHIKK